MTDKLVERTNIERIAGAHAAVAADSDHMVPSSPEEFAWLVAQLACWPARVDERFTTNVRFLMVSAAAVILADRTRPQTSDLEQRAIEMLADECARSGLREYQAPTMGAILRTITKALTSSEAPQDGASQEDAR